MATEQESPDFDQDLTMLSQHDVLEADDEPESGGAEVEPDVLTPTISEEEEREEEAMDAWGMLTEQTRFRLLGDLFDLLAEDLKAAWILNRIPALDIEYREEVGRQSIQLDALAYAREKAAADAERDLEAKKRAEADQHAVKAEEHRMRQRRHETALLRVIGPFATFGRGDAE